MPNSIKHHVVEPHNFFPVWHFTAYKAYQYAESYCPPPTTNIVRRVLVSLFYRGRKWRFREVQGLDQDHTARKRRSWGLNPECLLFPWCLEPEPCCLTPLRSQRRCLGGWGELPVTPTFACSSDSSGDTGKCPVHLLQPPARDWGIPGAGPQRECLGSGGGGGLFPTGRGVSEDPTSPDSSPPGSLPSTPTLRSAAECLGGNI